MSQHGSSSTGSRRPPAKPPVNPHALGYAGHQPQAVQKSTLLLVIGIFSLLVAVGSAVICGLLAFVWWRYFNFTFALAHGRQGSELNNNLTALCAVFYAGLMLSNLLLISAATQSLSQAPTGVRRHIYWIRLRVSLFVVEALLMAAFMRVNGTLKDASFTIALVGVGFLYPAVLYVVITRTPALRRYRDRMKYW